MVQVFLTILLLLAVLDGVAGGGYKPCRSNVIFMVDRTTFGQQYPQKKYIKKYESVVALEWDNKTYRDSRLALGGLESSFDVYLPLRAKPAKKPHLFEHLLEVPFYGEKLVSAAYQDLNFYITQMHAYHEELFDLKKKYRAAIVLFTSGISDSGCTGTCYSDLLTKGVDLLTYFPNARIHCVLLKDPSTTGRNYTLFDSICDSTEVLESDEDHQTIEAKATQLYDQVGCTPTSAPTYSPSAVPSTTPSTGPTSTPTLSPTTKVSIGLNTESPTASPDDDDVCWPFRDMTDVGAAEEYGLVATDSDSRTAFGVGELYSQAVKDCEVEILEPSCENATELLRGHDDSCVNYFADVFPIIGVANRSANFLASVDFQDILGQADECVGANVCAASYAESVDRDFVAGNVVEYTFRAFGGHEWFEVAFVVYDSSGNVALGINGEKLVHIFRGKTTQGLAEADGDGFITRTMVIGSPGTYYIRAFTASYDQTRGGIVGSRVKVKRFCSYSGIVA